ncbi:membrane-associated progesterone receptor component 1-like [Eupeodes corollae]|uniref:membrane-associated progesterone receptor component 1-like n=1 Tax=Eupeodes corollae TaxID=290404 RepID=UPI002490CFF0|nr:membrane-associated progesterone receptor component 1-like [Eupeodes corollae]
MSGENIVIDDSSTSSSSNTEESASFIASVINEIIYSPMNLALVAVIAFLVYKIIKDRIEVPHSDVKPPQPELPKLRRDFTIQELRAFDGNQPDGRVLIGVNGSVYDVTKGKNFYGPGGPYASFAGRDASRNLATFNVTANDNDEYDDLSDLNAMEMDSVREWEMQFKEKYIYVGRLLKKGEQPTNYSDEDEDATNDKQEKSDEAPSSPAAATDDEGLRKRTTATASAAPASAATPVASESSKVEEVK